MSRKIDRRNVGFAVAIFLGLAIGIFIKRVPLGLLIGVILGVLAGGLLNSKKQS